MAKKKCIKTKPRYKIVENRQSIKIVSDDDINLHIIGDSHYGNNSFDRKLFEEAILKVDKDPNARVVFNGDMLEFIPDGYKISQRGQTLTCEDQLIEFVDMVMPIREKIICIIRGNHEFRSLAAGNDVMKIFVQDVGGALLSCWWLHKVHHQEKRKEN